MGTKVKRQYYSPESDGFYGAFYACPYSSEKAMIPGVDAEDHASGRRKPSGRSRFPGGQKIPEGMQGNPPGY